MTDDGTTTGASPGSLAEHVRAVVAGSAPGSVAERLADEAGRSADVAEFLRCYRAVDSAFREAEDAAEAAAGPCRLRYEDVAARIAQGDVAVRRRSRPWLAAAAAILAVAVAAGLIVGPRGDHRVELSAIRPEAADAAPWSPTPRERAALRAAPVIAALPAGPAPWFSDLGAARDAALATGRPLLTFVQHPTCPICEELEAGPLQDAAVRDRLDRVVAVRVSGFDDTGDPLLERDWPYLGAFSPDGTELGALPAPCTTVEIVSLLDAALARTGDASAVPWIRLRAAASALADAEAAREEDRLADAYRLWGTLSPETGGGAFASAAAGRISDLDREAARALAIAAATAPGDPGAVDRELAAAESRFRGTPWGVDLASVRAAWARDRRFPAWVPRTAPGGR